MAKDTRKRTRVEIDTHLVESVDKVVATIGMNRKAYINQVVADDANSVDLRTEINRLSDIIEEHDKDRDAICNAIESLCTAFDVDIDMKPYADAVKAIQAHFETLRDDLEVADDTITNWREACEASRDKVDELESQVKGWQDQYNARTAERDDFNDMYNATTRELNALQGQLDTANEIFKIVKSERDELDRMNNATTRDLNSVRGELDTANQKFEIVKSERDDINATLGAVRTERDRLKHTVDTLTKDKQNLQTGLNEITKQRDSLSSLASMRGNKLYRLKKRGLIARIFNRGV